MSGSAAQCSNLEASEGLCTRTRIDAVQVWEVFAVVLILKKG